MSELLEHVRAATKAAAKKLTEAEADGALARELLDDLAAASRTAVRTLPPDTSVTVLRRYVDADGRNMVEIEVDIDDDLAAFLDTLPDPNAFIVEAIQRAANASTLGRYAYFRQLNAAAAEFGLGVGWGPDLDAWMDHLPEPPRRLTAHILADHAGWLSQHPPRRDSTAQLAPDTDTARPASTSPGAPAGEGAGA